MDSRSILLAMLPVALTLINYAIVRDMLWGIFLGNKSKKSAIRIKAEQTPWARLTQGYMKQHLTKYQKEYETWKKTKLGLCLLTLAQIIGFTVMIVLRVPFWIVGVVCAVIVLLNVVLFGVMMNQTESSDYKHNRKGSPWKFEK